MIVFQPEQRDLMKRLHDNFMKQRFELMRSCIVVAKNGRKIQVTIDACYSDKILQAPHKVTFVHKEAFLEE